ncbi:uncharacterized protein LOC134280467 [Saccostrea cucullata]|uniref:uncharacterized protein LOC134236067 n=1 Tax=Saccostrea cuccullata TaxID=36930 RepID=UPI002ED132AC
MATSTIRAQEILLCHICDKSPTKLHCNPCQTDLCENCVGKHTMMSSSAAHEIINVTVDEKKRLVEENTSYLQDVIPKFKEVDEEIEGKMVAFNTRCDELEELVLKHGIEWHCVINNVMIKKKKEIARIREDGTNELRKYKMEMRDVFVDVQDTIQRNKEIVKSVDVIEICRYHLVSDKYQNIPLHFQLKLPTFVFKEIESDQLNRAFGVLKRFHVQRGMVDRPSDTPLSRIQMFLRKALKIREFSTGKTPLRQVVCVGSEEAWISGYDETISRVNIQGSVLDEVITTCNDFPSDITVSKRRLIYTDTANKVVNIVEEGESITLIRAPRGWEPLGVSYTKSGDLLVSMRTTDQTLCKIVRYKDKMITQEIEKDDKGNPLYRGGSKMLFVAEDDNGDICASDCNANAFIVVNSAGKLLCRYTERQMKCNPCGIIMYVVYRILQNSSEKSSYLNDQYGRRRFCSDLGHSGPHSVDRSGRLWLGESRSGNVIVVSDEKQLVPYCWVLIILIVVFLKFT